MFLLLMGNYHHKNDTYLLSFQYGKKKRHLNHMQQKDKVYVLCLAYLRFFL